MSPRNPPPITATVAAGRTVLQAGVSVTGLFGLLDAFDIAHFTTNQILYASPFLTAAAAFAMRVVENRTGRGFLRRVP